MFRTMKKGNIKVKVYGWGVLKNGWEYYFTDNKHFADIRDALVLGYETEFGSVSQKEIKPYLITYARGEALMDIAPPPEWQWV